VEIENLYDPALRFEPIHRIVFGMDAQDISALGPFPGIHLRPGQGGIIEVESEGKEIVTTVLQPALDAVAKSAVAHSASAFQIDYIHGAAELKRICAEQIAQGKKVAGLLLPPLHKEGLFETVAKSGPLPRKSFSLGESYEKRYYYECRKIR
jgi:hypothetical protein